jgi:type IV secretion system protein VirD4
MRYRYPWRAALVGLALALIGWGIAALGWSGTGLKTVGVGAALFVIVTGWWWARYVARPHTTKALVKRRAELDQRSAGVATPLDIAEIASPKALRLQGRILRPATWPRLSRWARRRIAATELGVQVAKLGWGLWGQTVWSSIEDATMRIGGPRQGKTRTLAPYGERAPGALITTSTRLDLAEALHGVRLQRGAVHFFNPTGLGGLPSTVRWRVLDGCEDFETADRRAADLIPPSAGDREVWDTQARRILALLLHAAALSGKTMRDVVRWSAGTGDAQLKEVIEGLVEAGSSSVDRVHAIREHWRLNDRTKSSITSTIAIPLAWMSNDRARELGDADGDDPQLVNIRDLILRGQTLHLIGHEQHGTISPLIGAFVAEIAHAARTLAANQPGRRLDPPLTMLLDEAAIVIPVPLHQWTADMGGSGITIHMSVQSLAQTRGRWGEENANALLGNIACFIVFGGSAIHDDLAPISAMTGRHRMKVLGVHHPEPYGPGDYDARGQRAGRDGEGRPRGLRIFGGRRDRGSEPLRGEYEWRPVLSEADLRALEPGQVLVLRRNLHAVIGWAPSLKSRRRVPVVPLPRTGDEAVAQLEAMLAAQAAPSPLRAALTGAAHTVAGAAAGVTARLLRAADARRIADAETRPLPVDPVRTPDDGDDDQHGDTFDGRNGDGA